MSNRPRSMVIAFGARSPPLKVELAKEKRMLDLVHFATVDVRSSKEASFNEWHRQVQIPKIMTCPGWLSARRYECTNGEPRFLDLYELADEQLAFSTPQYEAAFGWDDFAFHIRDAHRRNYSLIFASGSLSEDLMDLIHVCTADVTNGKEADFNRWYNEVHVPEMMACPGWSSARRYECTNGEPRFLVLYEIEDEQLAFSTPQYEAAFGWDEFAFHVQNWHSRNYRLIHEVHSEAA